MKRSSEVMVYGAALLIVLAALGQESRQGWKLKPAGDPDMVHFTVERWTPNSNSSHSNDVPLSRFQGLSTSVLEHGGPAKFEYVQDAGRFLCQGNFGWNGGSGSFTFAPNPQFVSDLKGLGYQAPDDDQLFTMALSGVGLQFARGVKDAGLNASTGQVIDLRIHGVSLNYIAEARQAGYQNLSAQDYIDLRIHGVTTDFMRNLKSDGYNLDISGIVDLRIHGVTTDFMRELKRTGYNLSAGEITQLRIHGVDSEYMRELRAHGLQPAAPELVQLRIHGVTPDYLAGLKSAGYSGISEEQIVQLRIHGVGTDFIKDAKDLGYNFTASELVELRIHGVTGAYLKTLRDSGMRNLTAEQIARLRMHGVE